MSGIISLIARFLPGGGILTTLLSLPAWVWIAGGVAVGTMYLRYDARRDAWEACRAEHRQAQNELLKERNEAAQQVIEDARKEADAANARIEKLELEIARHESELGPDGACVLTDDLRKRLRSLTQ